MLDMGFADDLDAILTALPKERQTALFSATIPPRIASIAKSHLNNPARITIARETTPGGAKAKVREIAYVVRREHKPEALGRVLDMESPASAIVFCRTRTEVDHLDRGPRRPRLRRRVVARRTQPGTARPGDASLSRRDDATAHRDRRRRARARHRPSLARRELRRPLDGRRLRPSRRTHRARRQGGRGDHAARAARTAHAAQHRAAGQAQDHHRDRRLILSLGSVYNGPTP